MTEVNLDYLYLHNAADDSTFLTFDLDALAETTSRNGAIRQLASGRRRAVFLEGVTTTWAVSLMQVSRAGVDALREWANDGTLLMARDPRGRLEWGHVRAPSFTEIPLTNIADVTFTFEAITFTEEV